MSSSTLSKSLLEVWYPFIDDKNRAPGGPGYSSVAQAPEAPGKWEVMSSVPGTKRKKKAPSTLRKPVLEWFSALALSVMTLGS